MTKPTKWHPPSLIRVRCPHEETLGPQLPIEHTAKADHIGRIPRLIRVFGGRTVILFVGFVLRQLVLFSGMHQQRAL